MWNVLLDRVELERYRQKEDEDFESFYVATQWLAFDTDLVNNHCAECSKKCPKARVVNKLMANIKDQEVRTKLLKVKEDDFSLENNVTICRTEENSRRNEQKLSAKHVNYLNLKPRNFKKTTSMMIPTLFVFFARSAEKIFCAIATQEPFAPKARREMFPKTQSRNGNKFFM